MDFGRQLLYVVIVKQVPFIRRASLPTFFSSCKRTCFVCCCCCYVLFRRKKMKHSSARHIIGFDLYSANESCLLDFELKYLPDL